MFRTNPNNLQTQMENFTKTYQGNECLEVYTQVGCISKHFYCIQRNLTYLPMHNHKELFDEAPHEGSGSPKNVNCS